MIFDYSRGIFQLVEEALWNFEVSKMVGVRLYVKSVRRNMIPLGRALQLIQHM